MSRSALVGHHCMHAALAASLLLPLACNAQGQAGQKSVSSAFSVTLTVRPAFRILEMTPVGDGHQYRVWTNLKKVQLNGREYRFERVGESTLVVPGPPIEPPVDEPPQTRP